MIRARTRLRLALLSLVAGSSLLLSGCGFGSGGNDSGNGNGGSPAFHDLDGNWQLFSATDSAGEFDLSGLKSHGGTADVTLTLTDGRLGGTAACNQYFGEFVGLPAALRVEGLGQTEMACVDNGLMALESRYLTALSAVTSARLGSGVGLILLGDGVGLSFLPIIDGQ
jgi:heat shock protein HslJ